MYAAISHQPSAISHQPSAISHQPSAKSVKAAFTLVELLATVAILAVLTVMALEFVPSYTNWARQTAERQTLTILNDALTRYKCEGGNLSALTQGAYPGHVLALMQQPLNWAGKIHNVMQSGMTYPARSLSALGGGSAYQFTRFDAYTAEVGGTPGYNTSTSHASVSFTDVGTTTWTVPDGVNWVEVLVVAGGGGGGGQDGGGGGGAGGVIHQTGYGVTPGSSISLSIGAGGTGGGPWGPVATNGENSVFGTLTAIGGGACPALARGVNGNSGGSGGGGSGSDDSEIIGSGGAATPGQGNIGGAGGVYFLGGGGGGAGGPGESYSSGGNNGGIGLQFSISGTPTYYGGGGAGAWHSGLGGLGGGGNADGGAGTPNTGGGGAGEIGNNGAYGGAGGSGIVIVKY
jgi:prepilin-type N-terminal cleavage/methylation domain-containing protein